MTQRRLHEVNRGAPVERVRGVGMPQPVGADVCGNPRALAGLPDDPCDARTLQGFSRTRREHRRARARYGLQSEELAPTPTGRKTTRARPPLPRTRICPASPRAWRFRQRSPQASDTRNPAA